MKETIRRKLLSANQGPGAPAKPLRCVVLESLPSGLRVGSLRLFVLAIALLPRKMAFALARSLGRVRYRWWRQVIRRQAANMQARLGADQQQVERWLSRWHELEMCEILEGYFLRRITKEKIGELLRICGLEILDTVLARNKGAILYSGHVRGNYTFITYLALLGYKPHFIRLRVGPDMKPVARWFHDRYNSALEKVGCRFLWMERGKSGVATQATEILKKNGLIVILVDMSFSKQNVKVNFFGMPAPFPRPPAALAQATGAPLIDFFLYRTDEWVPQMAEIGMPFYVREDIDAAVQHCASRLEEQIRRHPADWAPWHIFNQWS